MITTESWAKILRGFGYSGELSILESVLNNIDRDVRSIEINSERIQKWCAVIREINPIHTNPEAARAYGLEREVAPGTLLAAHGENLVSSIVNAFNQHLPMPIKYVGFEIAFRQPVYPATFIYWRRDDSDALATEDGFLFNVDGLTSYGNVSIPLTRVLLSQNYKTPKIVSRTPTYSEIVPLTSDVVDGWHYVLGAQAVDETKTIPFMLPASFVTSAALAFARNKTGRITGLHLSSKFDFYKEPVLGKDVVVELFFSKQDEDRLNDRKRGVYNIEALCKQEGQVLLYVNSIVLSK